jgi:hypothetical protein
MYYQSGQELFLGDKVIYNKQQGSIVCLEGKSIDEKTFDTGEWKSCPGILIRFDNGALLHLEDSDDSLLIFSERSGSRGYSS